MELIKIYQGNLIDARELWEFLEIKTEFRKWIQRNLITHFEEGKEFRSFLTETSQKGGRPQKDYFLTIETAKKLAMMAKTPKGNKARQYFIECEKVVIELKQNKRFEAFFKLEATKEKLRSNIEDIGGAYDDYLHIDLEGRKVFFNGEPVADEELPTLLLKGRDFATEMTNEILSKENYTLENTEELHKKHHQSVRQMLKENINKHPEELPTEEKIKKLGE